MDDKVWRRAGGGGGGGGGGEGGGGARDTESKTRTQHKDVGKKDDFEALFKRIFKKEITSAKIAKIC